MVKLLSIITLVLAIVLFPPAALAVISNNAVPGDVTYPIKRALEDGIFAVASLHPTTKAWFSAARSDRRYKEFTTLVSSGKAGGESLNELVEQTQVAADQIAKIDNQAQRQQLVQQLSESIQKYDKGLEKLSPQQIAQVPTQEAPTQEEPTDVPQSTTTPIPTVIPTTQPTARPTTTPSPTARPTSVPTVVPTVAPTVAPTSPPTTNREDEERRRQIEEARRRLEEIQRRLQHQSINQTKQEDKQQEKQEKKEEKKEGKNKKFD